MRTKQMLAMGVGAGIVVGIVLAILAFSLPGMQPIAAGAPISNVSMQAGAPGLISYQGFLSDSNSQPYTGTVSMDFAIYDSLSGGSALWQETQSNVSVGAGYFTVQLGSITPLTASVFDGTSRYLQVRVDTGTGPETLPRQRLTAVPYALQAEQAASADAAPWSGLTGVPPGFADGVDDSGASYENVITVAKSGGDYTSVAAALNSISSSDASNRYLVWVAPGVYTETELVSVGEYVHLRGAGPNATVITSARTGNTPGNSSATVDLLDNSRISDLTVRNTGSGTFGIALYSAETSRSTVVDNVVAEAIGTGGTGHFAAYWNDAEATIRNSILYAGGATGFGTAVNAAFGSVNISNGFPQALIEHSILLGGAASNKENCNDNTGTGFGMQLRDASPVVRSSYICGGHRGIALNVNGNPLIQHSSVKVSSTGQAALFEISASGSISVANSGVSYLGNKFTGAGTGLRCVHTYNLGTWQPLSDGTTAATACN